MAEKHADTLLDDQTEYLKVSMEERGLSSTVRKHLQIYFLAHDGGLPSEGLYERIICEIEKPLIELSLAATRGNQLRAARLLGMNRNTLRKKIIKLNILVKRSKK